MRVEELQAVNLRAHALGQYLFNRSRDELQAGIPVAVIQAALIEYYDWLGEQGRDEDQDTVADVMDSVTGKCSPTARLNV
jgi:hypothetical protein